MKANGRIAQIKDVKSVSSEAGTKACVSAIVSPEPYGVWTDAMKAALGEEQEITFEFKYQ